MSKYYVKVFTDNSNEIEWEALTPDKIHHIEFKGKMFDEVRYGRWIYDDEAYPCGNPYGHYDCDQCGESVPHKTNYCPNCGAKMDLGEKNANEITK